MKKELRKWIFRLGILFLVLFMLRLLYGYSLKIDYRDSGAELLNSFTSVRKNYASKEYFVKSGSKRTASPQSVDQKFEKVADIVSKSTDFEMEEQSVRTAIKAKNALIQFEQKRGNAGRRSLQFLIGVPPENFDGLYEVLIKVGTVSNKSIIKKDKTNEYKELNSKKASLNKVLESLIELKSKNGKIEEFINLENRILDVEQQLQELGVSLGDFDSENEFCTVKFSLNEEEVRSISFAHRLKVAFEWTVEFYLMLLGILTFIIILSYFSFLLLDKLKVFEKLK